MTFSPQPPSAAQVLVVDDEAIIVRLAQRILSKAGFDVITASSAEEAECKIARADLVLCDDGLPGARGHAFLDSLRAKGVQVPFILMTGVPTVSGVVNADDRGVTSFVLKPFRPQELVNRVRAALEPHRDADADRLREQSARREKHEALDRALSGLKVAFQPIAEMSTRSLFGYEALMRSSEPSLPHPGAVLEAAEEMGRLQDVGRRVRQLAAESFARAPSPSTLFVNLHPLDLEDEDLFATTAPLAEIATRVVLEITERANFQNIPDGTARLARLRRLGYRVAVDDLGAGYAGLTSLVELDPDVVKLDMALVHGIDREPRKQRVVHSLVRLCAELERTVIAEGVEAPAELAVLRELGCDLVQGYLLARPGPPFPEVRW